MRAMAVLAMLVAISSCSGGGGAPTAPTHVEPPPAEPPTPAPPPPVALANCEPGAPVWMEIPVCAEGSRDGYGHGGDLGAVTCERGVRQLGREEAEAPGPVLLDRGLAPRIEVGDEAVQEELCR